MRHIFILTGALMTFVFFADAQSLSRRLSNLTHPTRINANLLPDSSSERNLGSFASAWGDMYFTGNFFKSGFRFLSSDGMANTFLGISSGGSSEGSYNTSVGQQALFTNQTGYYNSSFGYQALYNNIKGTGNTASGSFSLLNNTTGAENTAIGDGALYSNTSGDNNTAIGSNAMGSSVDGSENTAIGYNAGALNYGYSQSTFLGAGTAVNDESPNLTNVTVVGYHAAVYGSNSVGLGNSFVTSIGGAVNWSTLSDGRYKKNIKENVPGLDFISQLRPVTYNIDVDKVEDAKKALLTKNNSIHSALNRNTSESSMAIGKNVKQELSAVELKAKAEKAKVIYTGFIAQEVEQAAKKLNYDFSGVDAPKNEKSFYALRYGDFIVPLVKAVQELKNKNEELSKKNEELEERLNKLEKIAFDKNGLTSANLSVASVDQNLPNPFSGNTVIRYRVPASSSSAKVLITDIKGSVIKSVSINNKGVGELTINSASLAAGAYTYTLLVDGKQIDSKQMVIRR